MSELDGRDGEDRALAAALRRVAGEIAGTVDSELALERVRARARRRRRSRVLTAAVGAAAAAVVGVLVLVTVSGDGRPTLRTPATQPGAPPPTAGEPAAATTSSPPTATAPPAEAVPATTASVGQEPPPSAPAVPVPTSTAAAPPVVPVPTSPSVAPPATTTYDSAGGSLTVRVDGSTIGLVTPPEPTTGWSYRIDDDGPTRVRVRFELDDRRSEIRVDVVDGRPVPRITED